MSVCFCVCLSAEIQKNSWTDSQETLWKDETWAKREPIRLWCTKGAKGFFWTFCAYWTFTPISQGNSWILMKKNLAYLGNWYLWVCTKWDGILTELKGTVTETNLIFFLLFNVAFISVLSLRKIIQIKLNITRWYKTSWKLQVAALFRGS